MDRFEILRDISTGDRLPGVKVMKDNEEQNESDWQKNQNPSGGKM